MKIKYVCPHCGDDSLYSADVTCYWDVDSQTWLMSDTAEPSVNTTLYCGDCGEETNITEARKEI